MSLLRRLANAAVCSYTVTSNPFLSMHSAAVRPPTPPPARPTPIDDPDRLVPGQHLIVPPSPTTGRNAIDYHVVPGDSLSSSSTACP